MKVLSRVRWKLALACLSLALIGMLGWTWEIWSLLIDKVFAHRSAISAGYGFLIMSVSICHLVSKKGSLQPSITTFHVFGPFGDFLISGISTWSAFNASLAVLRFVILDPTTLELTSWSQRAVIGLPLGGIIFWSTKTNLLMAKNTFVLPESAMPTVPANPPTP